MKFIISNEELRKALETVGSVFTASQQKPILSAVNGFIKDNKNQFRAASDVENYASDLKERWETYEEVMEIFMEKYPLGVFGNTVFPEWELYENKIQEVVKKLLTEVFVRNEKLNFKKIIAKILKEQRWKHFAGLHFLSVMNPDAHEKAVEFLNKMIRAFEAHYIALEIESHLKPYLTGVLQLLSSMKTQAGEILETIKSKNMLRQENPEQEEITRPEALVSSEKLETQKPAYPAWVFRSLEHFSYFNHIHNHFCTSERDVAYLYRKLTDAKWIVSKMCTFREWYNDWEECHTPTWNQFKTLDKLEISSRKSRFNLACTAMGITPPC